MDKNHLFCVSSLEKVFPNEEPKLYQNEYTVLIGETFHFQVVAYSEELIENLSIELQSEITERITIRVVENIPSAFAVWNDRNDGYVIAGHGNNELYPDLLRPFNKRGENLRPHSWKSFWITVKDVPAGEHLISIRVRGTGIYEKLFDKTVVYKLTVLDAVMPSTDLIYTSWIHYDCICDKHGVEPYSKDFYKVATYYIESAVRHGMNMLLVPLFTPMLDVAAGEYRKNVQLVKIKEKDGVFSFDFSEVENFMEWAISQGIEYFELSPLATQWGAKYCPRIEVEKDGKKTFLFGWEEKLPSIKYKNFLRSFMNEFALFINKKGYENRIYFHISDEPQEEALERDLFIKEIIAEYFPDAKILDALSSGEFYRQGIINTPVVAIDSYENFSADWVYYCGCMRKNYCPNRHFAMPSLRNRILGWLLYRNNVKGFLHWGFNYYYGGLTYYELDPYAITDRGGCTESGDCFLVYPAKNCIYESLRHEVFYDAIQDYKALTLLEKRIGKANVLTWLEQKGIKEGFAIYPKEDKYFLELRAELNKKIIDTEEI